MELSTMPIPEQNLLEKPDGARPRKGWQLAAAKLLGFWEKQLGVSIKSICNEKSIKILFMWIIWGYPHRLDTSNGEDEGLQVFAEFYEKMEKGSSQ